MGFALFGISAPVFWLGLMALYIFWRSSAGPADADTSRPPTASTGFFSHMILPWIVLALLYAAFYARMTRNNLLETLGEDYIRTARAKGLSERKVIFKHGLRASLTPIVTMFGLDIALLVGGAIITETVFNIQGLGWLAINSAQPGPADRPRGRKSSALKVSPVRVSALSRETMSSICKTLTRRRRAISGRC